jgi:methionine-rich copper-binding protein CopC
MMRLVKVLMVIAVAVVSLAGARAVALAHAKIQSAEPKPGSTVNAAPKMVKIVFTLAPDESLDPKTSTITVSDSHGRRVDDGKGGVDLNDMDRKTLSAMLKPIMAGTYTVRWKAVSSPDKDVEQGSFKFTVAAAMGTMPMASPGMQMSLPPLKIISPANGATVSSPVLLVFETTADLSKMTMGATGSGDMPNMQGSKPMTHLHADLDKRVMMPAMKQIKMLGEHRYQLDLGSAGPGKHTVRLYWADNKTHKTMGMVHSVSITVK